MPNCLAALVRIRPDMELLYVAGSQLQRRGLAGFTSRPGPSDDWLLTPIKVNLETPWFKIRTSDAPGKSPYLNYSLSCSSSSVDFFMV